MEAQGWAWRLVVRGTFREAWIDASEVERGAVFDAWTRAHRAWQEAGCRLIVTMDDVLKAGKLSDGSANFYTVWEIPDPSIVHDLIGPFWSEEAESEIKLARYFSVDVTIGKPIVSMENALGGPQLASAPTTPGDFA